MGFWGWSTPDGVRSVTPPGGRSPICATVASTSIRYENMCTTKAQAATASAGQRPMATARERGRNKPQRRGENHGHSDREGTPWARDAQHA